MYRKALLTSIVLNFLGLTFSNADDSYFYVAPQSENWVVVKNFGTKSRFSNSPQFSADGKSILVSTGNEGLEYAQVWDLNTKNLIFQAEATGSIISPDSNKLVTCNYYTLRTYIWDIKTGDKEYLHRRHCPTRFSPDSKRFLTDELHGGTMLWNANSNHTNVIESTGYRGGQFSFDSKRVLFQQHYNSSTSLYLLIEGSDGVRYDPLNGDSGNSYTKLSPNDNIAATQTKNKIVLWDVETLENLFDLNTSFSNSTMALGRMRLSPRNEIIALSGSLSDTVFEVWNTNTGVKIHTLENGSPIEFFVLSSSGKYALSSSKAGALKLWDISSGNILLDKSVMGGVKFIQMSPDEKSFMTRSMDGSVRIWDAFDGGLVSELENQENKIVESRFGPNSRFIYTVADDGTVQLWERVRI